MNACSSFLVHGLLALLLLGGTATTGLAQKELTKDFSKLSAKERSRIAAQENREAAADSGYQAVMVRADHAFQSGQYDEALSLYQEARALRPYNVYPKVKIEDLEALIQKRDAAPPPPAAPPVAEPPPTAVPPPAVAPEAPEPLPAAPAPAVPPVAAEPLPAAPPPATRPAPAAVPPPTPAPPPAVRAKPAAPQRAVEPSAGKGLPEGIAERVYMEAGAVVTERIVQEQGRTETWRRVAHPWGGIFFFKDGAAVPQLQWDQRFTE